MHRTSELVNWLGWCNPVTPYQQTRRTLSYTINSGVYPPPKRSVTFLERTVPSVVSLSFAEGDWNEHIVPESGVQLPNRDRHIRLAIVVR